MDYRYKQLEQDLSALTNLYSDLGSRLTEAAKDVATTGILPSEKLIEQILTVRTKFESVRTAVHSQAAAMLVSPLPKAGELASIHALGSLLKSAAAAEESKSSAQGEIDKATAILSRVLAITHRETGSFAPLQECHAKITELRDAVSTAAWPNRHPELETINALRHPCSALLNFVENLDTLEDDKWMALETTITEAYGKPLFVAASRGKLVAQAASGKAPETPKATVAPEKPVERKPAVDKLSETMVASPAVAAKPIEKKEAPAPPAPGAPAAVAPAAVAPAPPQVPATPPPSITPITSTTIPPRPPAPVAAPPAAVAPPPAAATSLSALASATEAPAEKKPTAAPTENGDKPRKEPRLATPAQPQPAARTEPAAQEQESAGSEEGAGAMAGDGSQRPQRWGFWRGNR